MSVLEKAPDMMTVQEAAKILRVGRTTLYRLIKQDDLGHVRIGRKIVVPRIYLENFIEKNRTQ